MVDRNTKGVSAYSPHAEAQMRVQLSVKEIYEKLCPKCKRKLRNLIKDKIAEHLTDEMLRVK